MARKQKDYHYIYKTTCNVSGRYYIGMHSTDNLNDGYLGSGKRLWNSIKKHGRENHSIEILEHYESREVLKNREKELVCEELLNDAMCMNLVVGGTGFAGDDHTYEASKIGVDNRKFKLENDSDFKDFYCKSIKNGVIKSYQYGRNKECNWLGFDGLKHSEATLELMSQSKKGQGIGETNSQYGTCWITKNSVNKKIKKEELENHLNDGWLRGRK